jgi:outer membrane protein
MKNRSITLLTVALLAGFTLAQTATQTLEGSLKQALERGTEVANSRASLETARADLAVKMADPTTLAAQMLGANQVLALEEIKFSSKRIEVLGSVSTAYFNLFEAQENIEVLQAQLALDTRNLEVAQAKLAQKNGTELDVRKAQNTVASSKQNLSNANAQIPTLSNKLEAVLGLGLKGDLRVSAPPKFAEMKFDLAALEAGLEKNTTSVLQSAQGLETQELNVKLADNDYTPANTLRDAKTNLETAKRNFETAKKNAITNLRDASRNVINSLETVKLRQTDFLNDTDSLKQDQQRFKNGTISRVALQQTEVSAKRSEYNLGTAQNSYFKAINSLSSAAGLDVSKMLDKVGDVK